MLYEGLALLSGVLIAVMVTANGLLYASVGPWMSLVIIHICGLATVGAMLIARRRRFSLRAAGVPWPMYLAGVGGVVNTLLNNLCFGPLGAAMMLAITVVGQILFSSLIDHFGWFGMTRYPFRKDKLAGFSLMALGLLAMTLRSANMKLTPAALALYVGLALATGLMLATTGAVNASLAKHIGVLPGTLVNYLTGLGTSLLCTLIAGAWSMSAFTGLQPFHLLGGVLGVCIVSMTSLAMGRVPVVYVTVILFVGQVLMGTGIDIMNGIPLTTGKMIGCLLIISGLICNILLEKRCNKAQFQVK